MAKPIDVCIRGAGIVGRTLALQLASKRLQVALVASPAPPSPTDVRAYALSSASRRLLESVRCWPDEMHATAVLAMQVHGDEGGNVAFTAAEQHTEALNWIVDVPALEQMLVDAVRFQPLIDVVDAPPKATLTVVCEGKASSTRQEFGVDFDTTPYPQWALATRVQSAQRHGQVARQWFNQAEILALLPLGGPQGSECAIVWSVSPERAHALQNEPAHTFCEALTLASHAELGTLELTSARNIWPLQQAQARTWTGTAAQGAWALAGDAAHNVHPLAGQGLNLGLGDVAELVQILDQRPYWRTVADPKLLRQYERTRKAEFALISGAGDALQQLFYHPSPALQALRNWGMKGFERSGPLKEWVAQRAMGNRN
jgi:2-polyprenyl-6-methoxyphenol hydroxylase-like FAD-dependent oxidoreductase